MWKSLVLFFSISIFLVNTALSQEFGPPMFIADPDTLECRYYFSGDAKHFNPRPENYTEDLGLTTEFKDKDQACGLYRCVKTGGRILLLNKDDPGPRLCECGLEKIWNNETGCEAGYTPYNPITGLITTEPEEKTIVQEEKIVVQEKKNLFIRLWGWIVSLFK